MTEWLIRRFIPRYEETADNTVRAAYGTLAGFTGIFCNLLLFAVKFSIGILIGSSAVLSDAVNNFSDCLSCILTIAGSRIAARPADAEHPFGHGRLEYFMTLLMTAVIFSAAFELFKASVERIMSPTPLHLSVPAVLLLVLSLFVKLWLSRFNRTLGLRLNHTGLLAAARDSLNDVLSCALTIVSLFFSVRFTAVPIDGIVGALLALYVGFSGITIARDILRKLIGDEPEEASVKRIHRILEEDPDVLGVHDVIIHDYGPGNRLGSAHVELEGAISLSQAHDIIDRLEHAVNQELHITLTIHPDPVDHDEVTDLWRARVQEVLRQVLPDLSIHDFHVRKQADETLLVFDADVPYSRKESDSEMLAVLNEALAKQDPGVHCHVTFDRGYTSNEVE